MSERGLLIRDGRDEDAEPGAALLRESILQLCDADHNNDPAAIAAWLANKTAAEFRRWLKTPGQSLLVAESGSQTAGVGLIGDGGELLLLYVDPERRLTGVGRALLRALEVRALERGACGVQLESTITALSFYEAAGYALVPQGGLRLAKRMRAVG